MKREGEEGDSLGWENIDAGSKSQSGGNLGFE